MQKLYQLVMTTNRDKIIKLRVTVEEKEDIVSAAKKYKISTSEYLRQLHEKKQLRPPQAIRIRSEDIESLENAIAALAPIGNNLYQIARAINTNLASGLDIPENINLMHDLSELSSAIDKAKFDLKTLLAIAK